MELQVIDMLVKHQNAFLVTCADLTGELLEVSLSNMTESSLVFELSAQFRSVANMYSLTDVEAQSMGKGQPFLLDRISHVVCGMPLSNRLVVRFVCF